jgi:hypothetical protein
MLQLWKATDVFSDNTTGRFHLLGPQPVMGRDNELSIGEIFLQQLAELILVAGIHRHNNIIKEGRAK